MQLLDGSQRYFLPLLSLLLTTELLCRLFYFPAFYHPTLGISPLSTLRESASPAYMLLCVHGWFDKGGLWWFACMAVQIAAAARIGAHKVLACQLPNIARSSREASPTSGAEQQKYDAVTELSLFISFFLYVR